MIRTVSATDTYLSTGKAVYDSLHNYMIRMQILMLIIWVSLIPRLKLSKRVDNDTTFKDDMVINQNIDVDGSINLHNNISLRSLNIENDTSLQGHANAYKDLSVNKDFYII